MQLVAACKQDDMVQGIVSLFLSLSKVPNVSNEGGDRLVVLDSGPRRMGIGRCLCDNRGRVDHVRYRAGVRCS